MRAIIALIAVLFFLLVLLPTKSAFAVSVVISTPSSSLDASQVLEVDAFLQCQGSCGDSYLRGVFFQTEGDYSSFTQNISGEWIGSTNDRTSYFKIASSDLVQGTWSGKLRLKFDSSQSSGNYFVKVGRYTGTTGSAATWSNFYPILIVGAVQTSTPTPTSSPANTPTPTKTPTPTPTLRPSLSPTPKIVLPTSVLGESTQSGETVLPTGSQSSNEDILISNESKNKNNNWLQKTSIGIGGILLVACAILVFRKKFKTHEI